MEAAGEEKAREHEGGGEDGANGGQDGGPSIFDIPSAPGTQLDEYDILKPIGKGKFAVVYRAVRKSDGETGTCDLMM